MREKLRSKILFCVAFLLLSLAACRVSPDDSDILVTADPEFSVDLFEQRAPADGTPTFGLWVESMQVYDCYGYGIDATVTQSGGRIEVNLLGVGLNDPCAGAPATARQFLPIGNLQDGVYAFSLSLRDAIVNEGTLTVGNGRYILSMPNPQGIDFQNLVLERLPAGIVWGYAATPNEQAEPIADNFIFDLKTLTSESGLTPGFYSYFTVAGTGDVFFHKSIAPSGSAEPFVRKLTADPNSLKSLLQTYRNAAQQPLQIRCWTTAGEL